MVQRRANTLCSPSAHDSERAKNCQRSTPLSKKSQYPSALYPSLFSFQFDHSFVEVYRVRKFRFQPLHCEPASSKDLSETPKKAAFPAMCSPQTSCNYRDPQSSWTCDGEILRHTAITVR